MSDNTSVSLPWLDPDDPTQAFPDPDQALSQPNGLLAIGGDLSTARLLRAYARGIFPWYNPDEPILWWSPDPRTVFDLQMIYVPRRLARTLRRDDYAISVDRAFDAVTEACAAPRAGDHGTWLGPDMRRAYGRLHQRGHAHSMEVWRSGALIGGIYGVALGGVFFGESMFSRARDASKIALYWLQTELQLRGFRLLDCQVASDHVQSLGARSQPRAEFLATLNRASGHNPESCCWVLRSPDIPRSAAHLPAALRVEG